MPKARRSSPAAALVQHLRELGLRKYPGAQLKSPWPGHLDLAVNDKTFAYLSAPGDPPGVSLKLPFSCSIALDQPDAEPTAYGLGKSGWVSLSFENSVPPQELLESWLDESYRAQAPKKLLAQLDGSTGTAPLSASRVPSRKARHRQRCRCEESSARRATPGSAGTGTRPHERTGRDASLEHPGG